MMNFFHGVDKELYESVVKRPYGVDKELAIAMNEEIFACIVPKYPDSWNDDEIAKMEIDNKVVSPISIHVKEANSLKIRSL